MTSFNKTKSTAKTFEGAKGYDVKLIEEWLNNLFGSYLEDSFYETADTRINRLEQLTRKVIEEYGVGLACRFAHYARNEIGMRSSSNLVAAIINGKDFDGKRDFFRNYFHRPDDVAELFGAIERIGEKRSHAMIRGAADYLSTLSEYALGKYKQENRELKMWDIINVTHAHSDAISKLKTGELKPPDTWEVSIFVAKSDEERHSEWRRLVMEHKLGYLALIRNLRNICFKYDPEFDSEYIVPQLTDERAIKKSLVFPYQIYSAYKAIKHVSTVSYDIRRALESAFISSISNATMLSGKTLIIFDVSGSMDTPMSDRSGITYMEIGAVYATMHLFANNDTDVIRFANRAEMLNKNSFIGLTPFAMIEDMTNAVGLGGGTEIDSAIKRIDGRYDRIIIVSDMQTMDKNIGITNVWPSHRRYDLCDLLSEKLLTNGMPLDVPIYSFNLGAYHNSCIDHERFNIVGMTSLDDTAFKFMKIHEEGVPFL